MVVVATGWVLSACGSRPAYWDQTAPAPGVSTYGLQQSVAVVDSVNSRVTFLSPRSDQSLATQQLAIAHNVVTTAVSPDQKSLFILASGDGPQPTGSEQLPSLTWIAPQGPASTSAPAKMAATQFWMSNPLQSLVVDPGEQWAVAYAGAQTNFVQNVSELVLFDLMHPPNPSSPAGPVDTSRSPNPVSRTIQAFGGIPQQLSFTSALNLGNGLMRHLLLMETNIDVTLIDIDDAFPVPPKTAPPETTVRLTNGTDGTMVTPAGLAVYPGDANGPARIAIRASNDTNIFTLVLGPAAPTINLTDVGGIPSDIAFVMTDAPTDGGLRVAALVPSNSNAVLVEPDTSLTTTVALDGAYSSLSLVTQAMGTPAPSVDVALLWGAPAGTTYGVELWTLGSSVGTPYRSVQGVDVSEVIQTVDDVPGNPALKVLGVMGGSEFVVLNLTTQTAAPLETTQSASMVIAPDGGRMWLFTPQGTDLASIDFQDLNPIHLTTDLPIDAVYDVARFDASGRSLVAIHQQGTLGATVFDARNPNPMTARRATALLFEGP
jgi:hypothetical protein